MRTGGGVGEAETCIPPLSRRYKYFYDLGNCFFFAGFFFNLIGGGNCEIHGLSKQRAARAALIFDNVIRR